MRDAERRGGVHASVRVDRSRIPVLFSLLALVLLAPGATAPLEGCAAGDGGASRACTEIGCNDGVGFVVARGAIEPRERVVASACVGGRCTTHRFDPDAFAQPGGVRIDAWLPPETLDAARSHTASLTLREGATTILELERTVALRRSQPNGPGCPPTCHGASVRVTAADVRGAAG